ncbi:hypothetical protein J3Q64DRAFT_1725211 [Phycomyces blakesleeanus]|uniref:Uncharacterized protein n=2 Tax=Phycomyces blakesleeanus TaxID=4837 RepID=A0A163BCP8_PHYB8|nr:hypothetical protein PHYBLDRAFT_61726 [Phycomyces blakesleeanus NRRL 1555(-)]OAD80671.1 hypothetical protein PHYBLDRAFT_61726 [Phycomyces blakesleeanus NRRL 1555(-)]|eukprot:XP_018298711.1 hypothetical protein PHYBLDRAFT_61726 [Phycomyces blakesleeanus NRRL 1555(-)]
MKTLSLILFYIGILGFTGSAQAGSFIKPTKDAIWYTGSYQSVLFDTTNFTSADTVTFFFDEDRSITLGGGPAQQGNFTFMLPTEMPSLVSKDSVSLLGVFRRNRYLWQVLGETVKIRKPSGPAKKRTVYV